MEQMLAATEPGNKDTTLAEQVQVRIDSSSRWSAPSIKVPGWTVDIRLSLRMSGSISAGVSWTQEGPENEAINIAFDYNVMPDEDHPGYHHVAIDTDSANRSWCIVQNRHYSTHTRFFEVLRAHKAARHVPGQLRAVMLALVNSSKQVVDKLVKLPKVTEWFSAGKQVVQAAAEHGPRSTSQDMREVAHKLSTEKWKKDVKLFGLDFQIKYNDSDVTSFYKYNSQYNMYRPFDDENGWVLGFWLVHAGKVVWHIRIDPEFTYIGSSISRDPSTEAMTGTTGRDLPEMLRTALVLLQASVKKYVEERTSSVKRTFFGNIGTTVDDMRGTFMVKSTPKLAHFEITDNTHRDVLHKLSVPVEKVQQVMLQNGALYEGIRALLRDYLDKAKELKA